MPNFKAVLIEHGYDSIDIERDLVEAAGGTFVDCDKLPLEEALEACEDAQAVMCRRIVVTEEILRRFKQCQILIRYGVGTDNIDVPAATRAGIMVGHVPVYSVDEVSTHAIALLLACVRRLVATQKKVEAGGWEVHRNDPLFRMEGKTLGIIGLGNIGRAVARKLQGWGLKLLGADPFVEPEIPGSLGVELVDVDTLCQESDYITLHCPLLPETHHLINIERLAQMKPGAILVNTSRGPVVDTQGLLKALDDGQIAQAGLDVFEEEPLPKDSPFPKHPKLTVSDHTAWYSEESQQDLQRKVAEDLVKVCTGGLPYSLMNPELLVSKGRFSEWTVPENVAWQLKRLKSLGVKP